MKRFHILPDVKILPHDPSKGGIDYEMVAKAVIKEDGQGGWVHYDDAAAAIKQATESAGTVTLRQRYKIAAISNANVVMVEVRKGEATEDTKVHAGATAKLAAAIADAMLAEDEEHAKK